MRLTIKLIRTKHIKDQEKGVSYSFSRLYNHVPGRASIFSPGS
jgi:hypothetical protein